MVPAVLLAACVSSGPESQLVKTRPSAKHKERIEMTRTTDCAFASTINDFQVLDDTHVVLFGMGRRKAYLAELAGACFGVRNQYALLPIDGDKNGQICGFGRDSIAYERLGGVERCRIIAMQELSDERRLELGIGVPPRPPPKDKDKPKDEKPSSDDE
jgi:hypothetical protein